MLVTTAAVSGFKNSYPKDSDVGIGNNPGNVGGSKNLKQENDGKKRRNKGSKKQGKGLSVKCVKEKKLNHQVVKDQTPKQKKIPDRKGHIGFRKTHPKLKLVYRKKKSDVPNSIAIDVHEHPKIETEEITGVTFQEPDSNEIEEGGRSKESEQGARR